MKKTGYSPEILSPAGSVEQLVAAVNNGCDAVYLGLESFNARMKAPNFTTENISKWIDYCHLFGVRVFVAINTSLKNSEFDKAVDLLKTAYFNNADGVIVTDLALMRLAGKLPKPFDVVASTQLNIHDKFGASFVRECGATTVVCARESSFEDIENIVSTGIDVECFLHGAMCVCQSGQCLFSSIVGGNSGNRGLCAQPCRKKYYLKDGRDGYFLSARDIESLTTAKKLSEIGVKTFKIEGRNRRPEYAGITSKIYKNLFENDFRSSDNDLEQLQEMFNRSVSVNNYLYGRNDGIIFTSSQNHSGVLVGVVKNNGIALTKPVLKEDGFKVFDGDREVCGGVALESGNTFVKAKFDGKVVDGMRVHRTTSKFHCDDVMSAQKRLSVDFEFFAKAGECARLIAKYGGMKLEVVSNFVVERALNNPTTREDIVKQLQKSGNTYYTITDISCDIDDIFLPKSQINALRRIILDELTVKIIGEYNAKFDSRRKKDIDQYFSVYNDGVINCDNVMNNVCAVVCYSVNDLNCAYGKADYLLYKPEIIDKRIIDDLLKYDAFLDLPSFANIDYIYSLLKDSARKINIVCHNVGQVDFARRYGLKYIAGSGLNIFNDFILQELSDAETFVYSYELALAEISEFKNKNGLTFVDGKIPLMKLYHCPYKVAYSCDCKNCKADKKLTYKDESGNEFEIIRRRDRKCSFELLNGKKLSVVNKIMRPSRFLLDYDEAIFEHYLKLNNSINDGYVESSPYTKGRLFNKIN